MTERKLDPALVRRLLKALVREVDPVAWTMQHCAVTRTRAETLLRMARQEDADAL